MHDNDKLRIAYLSGPSEAASVFREWSENRAQNYFGTNYMKQFFQVCRELDADAYVITTVSGKYSVWHNGGLTIENRPLPSHLSGLMYHLAMVGWFARLAPTLIRFKPDVLIATANQNYWFLLFYLRWFGIPIIPSFHCVLWPKFAPVRRSWRVLLELNRLFILRHVKAALVASQRHHATTLYPCWQGRYRNRRTSSELFSITVCVHPFPTDDPTPAISSFLCGPHRSQ